MTLTITRSRRGEARRIRDTAGGKALSLLILSVVLSALLSRLIDGRVQRFDSEGHRYFESTGNIGRAISFLVLIVAAYYAANGIRDGWRTRPTFTPFTAFIVALVTWFTAVSVIRGDHAGVQGAIEVAVSSVIVVGCVISPPTRQTLRTVAHILNFAVASNLIYGLVNFDQNLPCRADKCGIFGNLFTGYLFQENSAARLVVLLVPAVSALENRWYYWLTLFTSGLFVAATGSRTSLLTYGFAASAAILLRRLHQNGGIHRPVNGLVRIFPALSIFVSLYFFLTATNRDLNSRGMIYEAIRRQLVGTNFLFGSGPDTVSKLRLGDDALAFGEHGQASHLLVYSGAVGLTLFVLATCCLAFERQVGFVYAVGTTFLVVAATQFSTEVGLSLDYRTMSFAVMLLAAGLLTSSSDSSLSAFRDGQSDKVQPR